MMVRRNVTRLLALAALAAVAAAALVVVLGSGSGGRGGGAAGESKRGRAAGSAPAASATSSAAPEVRPRPDWRPYSGPVPIFRYHAVGEFEPGERFPELFVEPDDFERQLDWLEAHGYEAVGLQAVEQAWFKGGSLPRRPVVLSFDGVRGELASTVAPALRRRGWPGVLVLDAEARLGHRDVVEGLLAAGWEVEAEGADVAGARRTLETELGAPVANFSYPQGVSAEATTAAVEAAGYEGATVVGPGFATSTDRYEMPRITVFGLSRVDGFAEAMRSRGEGVGA